MPRSPPPENANSPISQAPRKSSTSSERPNPKSPISSFCFLVSSFPYLPRRAAKRVLVSRQASLEKCPALPPRTPTPLFRKRREKSSTSSERPNPKSPISSFCFLVSSFPHPCPAVRQNAFWSRGKRALKNVPLSVPNNLYFLSQHM